MCKATPERISAALEFTTTLRLDAGRAISPLDRDPWLTRRREWLATGVALDAVLGAPLTDAAWHEARARDAEEDDEPFAARWHLDRLLARAPGDWGLRARRAATYTAERQYDLAAAAYEQVERCAPPWRLARLV